jgi:hypothetical protein
MPWPYYAPFIMKPEQGRSKGARRGRPAVPHGKGKLPPTPPAKLPTAQEKRRHRQNTSKTLLFPWQVADELLVSETEVYTLMALGAARGGIRCLIIGDAGSKKPRKLVHKDDVRIFQDFRRGILSKEEYAAALKAPEQYIARILASAVVK